MQRILSAPFVRLTRLRSAGITDLRYGYVLDVDWQGQDLFRPRSGSRETVPLPEGVACFAVAATTAARRSALVGRLVGDGLVPLNSALGQHSDARRSLAFAEASKWIAYRTSHMALLHSPAVTQQLAQSSEKYCVSGNTASWRSIGAGRQLDRRYFGAHAL